MDDSYYIDTSGLPPELLEQLSRRHHVAGKTVLEGKILNFLKKKKESATIDEIVVGVYNEDKNKIHSRKSLLTVLSHLSVAGVLTREAVGRYRLG